MNGLVIVDRPVGVRPQVACTLSLSIIKGGNSLKETGSKRGRPWLGDTEYLASVSCSGPMRRIRFF